MPYYINLNGRLTEVSEQEYRLFNIGTSKSPAAGGTETKLNTNQQIINPNTTTTRLTLEEQIAAVAAQQAPSAANAATADQIAAIERIQANRATPQPSQTVEEAVAAVAAEGRAPAPATSDDPETAAVLAAQAEADAIVAEQNQTVDDQDPFEAARLRAEAEADVSPTESAFPVGEEDAGALAQLEFEQEQNRALLQAENYNPEPVDAGDDPYVSNGLSTIPPAVSSDSAMSSEAARIAAGKLKANQESTNQARANTPAAADWRVRLSLAPGAKYLYNASSSSAEVGILAPLRDTNGVIFPYTPTIETSYQAKYQTVDLVHSNYRGQFYQNSYTDAVNIKGVFTAQDTYEAAYLLAVIHFFRSVTKMFYGQDQEAGSPPPLVFLSGLGQYQFNNHPCVVSNFQYSLPPDVDYIRANGFNNIGVNMDNRLNKSSGPGPGGMLDFVINKLGLNGLRPGGVPPGPDPNIVQQNVSNSNSVNSTYVPTKMTISVTLLPIQTRNQMSKQFSVKKFASGQLLQNGFW